MKIEVKNMSRQQLVAIIENYPHVQPAASGYEIPADTPNSKGRVHIIFCSEGIEVHHDKVVSVKRKHKPAETVHRVVRKSDLTKSVHKGLNEAVRAAAVCVCPQPAERWWCDKHGYNGHLLELQHAHNS